MSTNLPWRVVIFALLLLIVLPVSVGIYKTKYNFRGYNPNSSGTFTNEWVLQNKLPQSVIDIADNQVKKYSALNSGYKHYTIVGDVKVVDDKYTFTLSPPNNKARIAVGLLVNDSLGTLTIQTYINGQLQTLAEDNF